MQSLLLPIPIPIANAIYRPWKAIHLSTLLWVFFKFNCNDFLALRLIKPMDLQARNVMMYVMCPCLKHDAVTVIRASPSPSRLSDLRKR